jgi:hypothetical protein
VVGRYLQVPSTGLFVLHFPYHLIFCDGHNFIIRFSTEHLSLLEAVSDEIKLILIYQFELN